MLLPREHTGSDLAHARQTAERLATGRQRLGYVLNLRLSDPSSEEAFVNGNAANAFGTGTGNDTASFLQTAQDIRHDDFRVVAVDQKVLLIVGTLLALLAIASIAVVVGGRMAEQTRRVGLLKAVGGTPAFVAAVLLAENLLLGARGVCGRRRGRTARRAGAHEPGQRSDRQPTGASGDRWIGRRGRARRGRGRGRAPRSSPRSAARERARSGR